MAIDFPNSPSAGQSYVVNDKTWVWDGTSWNIQAGNTTFQSHGPTHGFGQPDAVTIAQSQVTGLSASLSGLSPISSPTFTGIPAAPTATAGTNTTQIATTAFVATAIGAIDALPNQSGNNGKFLGTNGTIASWQTVNALPSQTGNAGKTLTTDGTNASWAVASAGASKSTIFFLGGM
jgi:hypothetical protein